VSDMMEHKGYYGSVSYNDDDRLFYGKLEFIRGLISYEGQDVESLRSGFEEAVDDYLDLCLRTGREPDRPFKGTFNVRVGKALHRQAALAAKERRMSLNAFVIEALEQASRGRREEGAKRKR
jgi:predicted HicB family RNase H-like nuclease